MSMETYHHRKRAAWRAGILGLLGMALPTVAAYTTTSESSRIGVSVGAGAMSYIAQESPSTGLSLDARVDYRLSPALALEGGGTTAFSNSVEGGGTTVPLLFEGGLRAATTQGRNINLFAGAGIGYGAFIGTRRLQDGATFDVPLSLGAMVETRYFGVSPRFTYRPVLGDQLGQPELNADADSWTAALDVRLPLL